MTEIILNPDQEKALAEILAAREPGGFHVLTGYAGSGKTTTMQALARRVKALGLEIVLTAPTHKAVAVLARKCQQAGISVDCRTIHSLLSLKPKPHGDRLVFERKQRADPVTADVVVIDECSMVSLEMLRHIRRHLPVSFVLFVGDPAQLPPVGEEASQTFGTKSKSHLDTIVRQSSDNPLLDAADIIRSSQGGPMDWSWLKSAKAAPLGVFIPTCADGWMEKAFTSPGFAADPDAFRYLCWTNDQVARVNRRVRQWVYGCLTPTPFMPGERALVRSPVMDRDGQTPLLSTNEEATVLAIEAATFTHRIKETGLLSPWSATVPSWRVEMQRDDGEKIEIHIPRDDGAYKRVLARIADEAAEDRSRWGDHHGFKQRMGSLQPIYACTVHTSQGSTFRNVFVDVSDIRRRASDNVLEAQQLFYVAATRPTHALVLVNT